jgi:hypothetical protein
MIAHEEGEPSAGSRPAPLIVPGRWPERTAVDLRGSGHDGGRA